MKELEETVAKMRELGITHYKKGTLEIVLGEPNKTLADTEPVDQHKINAAVRKRNDKIMFAASPLIPTRRQ